MSIRRELTAVLSILGLALAVLVAPAVADSDAPSTEGVMERLLRQTGVYHRSPTASLPDFFSDPTWPEPLPNHWLLDQIGGLYVDQHDHIWVYNHPRTMTNDEAGLEPALPGVTDAKGQAIDALGFVHANGFGADCCKAAPSVLEFDAAGHLLRAWGGPSDPGFLSSRCKAQDGCIWPNSEHGIYVDSHDNVWIAGSAAAPKPGAPAAESPWFSIRAGGDGFILKFDMDGNFKLRIGGTPQAPDSNDKTSGINGTPTVYRAADMVMDPKTDRLYVADGYGNRRILIVDANSGTYIGHFGAYGSNPIDDAGAAAQGAWYDDAPKGNTKPAFFRNPVHCVKLADDGKLYVCDRGNNRIQVFDSKDASLGKPCSNPNGEAGKCGFIAERWISGNTYTPPVMPGTAVSMDFSRDKAQSCLFIGDNTNQTIYIVNRGTLQELGRLGHVGRMTGDFHWLHQLSLDSAGNLYTAEVDSGKRIQKFVRYGALGCSGTGTQTIGGP